jgi:PAS domain S-box-containing protein
LRAFFLLQKISDFLELLQDKLNINKDRFWLLPGNLKVGFIMYKLKFNKKGKPIDIKILYINDIPARFYKVNPGEIMNRTLKQLNVKFESRENLKYINVAITGKPTSIEKYDRANDLYYRVFMYSPRKLHVLAVWEDITLQKKLELANHEIEKNFSLIVNTSKEGIVVADKNYVIYYTNNRFPEMLEFQHEEIINHTLEEFIDYSQMDDHNKRMENRKNGIAEKYERRFMKKNGSILWTEVSSSPILDPRKGFQGTFAMLTDISERKNIEEVLKSSEHRLRNLLKSITDYTYSVLVENGNAITTFISDGSKAVTGYSAEEFLNDKYLWISTVYQDDRQKVIDNFDFINKNLNSNLLPSPIEHRIIHKNGSIRWIKNIPARHFLNNKGLVEGYDGLITDITKEKLLESKILSSVIETEERERLYFSQELHDSLGPLLSAAKIYVQWLSMPNAHNPPGEILKDIERLINEASHTIREISYKLSPHILQNYGLVEALRAYIQRIEKTSRIHFELNAENEHRLSITEETVLYRVLCECLNNTIKHALATSVNILMRFSTDCILIEYSDDGKGFELNSVMSNHKGIGILNMQSRIKSIDGNIDINSNPGGGTIIKIQLQLNTRNFFHDN